MNKPISSSKVISTLLFQCYLHCLAQCADTRLLSNQNYSNSSILTSNSRYKSRPLSPQRRRQVALQKRKRRKQQFRTYMKGNVMQFDLTRGIAQLVDLGKIEFLLRLAHNRCQHEHRSFPMEAVLKALATNGSYHLTATDVGLLLARGYSHVLLATPEGSHLFRQLPYWMQLEVLLVAIVSDPPPPPSPFKNIAVNMKKSETKPKNQKEVTDFVVVGVSESERKKKMKMNGKQLQRGLDGSQSFPLSSYLRAVQRLLPKLDMTSLLRLACFLDPKQCRVGFLWPKVCMYMLCLFVVTTAVLSLSLSLSFSLTK